jgi:hypothetical protein
MGLQLWYEPFENEPYAVHAGALPDAVDAVDGGRNDTTLLPLPAIYLMAVKPVM